MGIKIFDLKTSKFCEEKVCAEAFMRFLYESAAGRAATFSVFRRLFFSRLCGLWADSASSAKAVAKFVADNAMDESEFAVPVSDYKTFNEFFTRELADGARPLAEPDSDGAVGFPSDGRHLLVRNASKNDFFYVKGARFDFAKFLGDEVLARRFDGGDMLVSRLCPTDYHRFHYPISGEIAARKNIDGTLFSVSPIALTKRLSIFWENKRILNLIDSPKFGMCAFVEIGATNVGSIENFGAIGDYAERGRQAGMFRFGGSCVATLFPPSCKIEWNEKLVEMGAKGIECYARANELAGRLA